jgi:hypothetical protein
MMMGMTGSKTESTELSSSTETCPVMHTGGSKETTENKNLFE